MRQRALTAVSPHQGNLYYIIPAETEDLPEPPPPDPTPETPNAPTGFTADWVTPT